LAERIQTGLITLKTKGSSMKLKNFLVNLGLFAVAIGIALLLAEFAARMVLNPSDFLKLDVVGDKVLGAVPSPSALAGFDRWGFRNAKVPETADIVAVGDSHTYGNTARMVDAWPSVLGQVSGRQVYNMGLGGYGPNQYFYLSKTKALTLKPKMIVWGLYMGDDFENAFSITYGLEYWSYLRKLPPQKVEANIWEGPSTDTGVRSIRVWLSRHSVIYQLVFHFGFGGRVKGDLQIRNAAQLYPGYDTSLVVPEKNILEAFRPKGVLFGLEQDNPNVQEGMRITFELLREMNELCKQNHVQFVVVVIPTKELVFSDYIEHNPKLPLNDVIDKLLTNERTATTKLFQSMSEDKIPYVYPLAMMKQSVGQGLYARSAGDMHPNKNGYRVIGESVAAFLKQMESNPQPAASAK
jgi:hypothetical protein